jgi:hypothetical protein
MSVSVAASMVMGAIMPRRLIAARIVTTFQLLSGVPSRTLRPPAQRAKRRVMPTVTPLSSRNTSRSGAIVRMLLWNSALRSRLAGVSCSAAWSDFFQRMAETQRKRWAAKKSADKKAARTAKQS